MKKDDPQLIPQLQEALLSAFPTSQDLEMMIVNGFDENLSEITGEGTLRYKVFELVQWARAKGRLKKLVSVALKENSENPELKWFARQFDLEEELPHHSSTSLDKLTVDDFIPMRNPYFTGRQDLLEELHEKLSGERMGEHMPVALTGLGGIGKTQAVIEYIYRYRHEYKFVLWVKADNSATLTSEAFKLAKKLDVQFTQEEEHDPSVAITRVRQWLMQNSKWLLVLDNVKLDGETPRTISQELQNNSYHTSDILKHLPRNGHILLTTRSNKLEPLADSVPVDVMSRDDGAEFLLHRSTILSRDARLAKANPEDRRNARELVELLGGLPLALEQAAAYIQETSCGVAQYYKLYQNKGKELRQMSHDKTKVTVATTWSLSFQAVQRDPVAAALLQAFSFFAPSTIPEEIITERASCLGDTLSRMDDLAFNNAMAVLLKYSLIQRNNLTQYIIIHQLVQEVLKDNMGDDERRTWMERIVRAVNSVFPDGSMSSWRRCDDCQVSEATCPSNNLCSNLTHCQRYLPHAQICEKYIEKYQFPFPEAAALLYHTAKYLHSYAASYRYAEAYYTLSLNILQQLPDTENTALELAANHNDLARLYRDQYQYHEAVEHFEEALRIREEQLGPQHPITAKSKRSLVRLYLRQGQYDKAETLSLSVLKIHEAHDCRRSTSATRREVANSSYCLARVYHLKGSYEEAQTLYNRVLAIDKNEFGREHPLTAQCLDSLGVLYLDRRNFKEAERCLADALEIRKKVLEIATTEGKQQLRHPETAQSLNDLGRLYRAQKRYDEAEDYINKALKIRRAVLGRPSSPDSHPDIAQSLSNLAGLYSSKKLYDQAEALYLKALMINIEILGDNHPHTAHSLSSLGELYFNQGRYDEAEKYTKQALDIRVMLDGPNPVYIAQSFYNLARLHAVRQRYELAELFYGYALDLNGRVLGLTDPRTKTVISHYADLLRKMNRDVEAAALEAQMGGVGK